MRSATRFMTSLLVACGVVGATLAGASAQARTPLLMEGKKTLYQRVLTRPGAELLPAPGAGATPERIAPFQAFYVYDSRETGGKRWIEVGRGLGGPEGWFEAERAIPWKQSIVAAFENPADRGRTLIFRDKDKMLQVYRDETALSEVPRLREQAATAPDPNGPVISIEPENHVDIERDFYILPILDFENSRFQDMRSRLLKIASLPLNAPAPPAAQAPATDYKVGIVFVIDTTLSMQPYIDMTRQAMEQLSDAINRSEEGRRVRFGLYGFRDNIDLRPELGYVAREYLPLTEESGVDDFITQISRMTAATTSSEGFNEDALAGVAAAVRETNWDPFGGRFVFVISDAGPRRPSEFAALGPMRANELNREAREKGVAVFSLHLKSAGGAPDHLYAEEQYSILSQTDRGSLYFPIEGANETEFRRMVERLSAIVSAQIVSGMEAHAGLAGEPDLAQEVQGVLRAMRLAYLGRTEGADVPDVFEGWLADRDPINPRARPVSPRVLLTKNQLATLRDVVREMIEISNTMLNEGERSGFFRRLQEAVAVMARDPNRVVDVEFETLGDLLGEYLEDLPYQSEIIGLNQGEWDTMTFSQEEGLFDSLRSKIAALERIHDDPRRWVKPYAGAPDGETLTTVPLELMP